MIEIAIGIAARLSLPEWTVQFPIIFALDFPLASIGWPWSHGYRVFRLLSLSLAHALAHSHFILPIFNYASLFCVRLRSFFSGLCFVFVTLAALVVVAVVAVAFRAPSMRKLLLIWTPCSVCTFATPTALTGCAHSADFLSPPASLWVLAFAW